MSINVIITCHALDYVWSIIVVYAGTQAARIVAIAAGSVGGGLLLLVAVASTIIVCLITSRKWKIYNLPTNQTLVENSNLSSHDKIATVTSVACKPVLHTATVNAGFGVMNGSIDREQWSTENWDSKLKLDMELMECLQAVLLFFSI